MSSRSGRRSRSRSRESRKGSRRDRDKPWLKRSRSRSSSSSSSSSRSRSSRRRRRQSRSRSKSPVRPVMSKDPKYVNSRVFVANFASSKASNTDLMNVFEKHGKIVDVLVHHNGYGFVQFVNEEDARKAIQAENGTMFLGKTLKCNMAAERRRGGGDEGARGGGPATAAGNGGGRGESGPPPNDRFGRGFSPGRDPYGPPPFDEPFMRGRDLPPPPRDFRDLPPPYSRDFLPPSRNLMDPLPPPPRDPFFDDPYRRPPPPDLYYDRFRDDPYRREPFRVDPYRDPYRDPYGPGLYDPLAAPKKPMAVDCEIIVMTPELRRYADVVEKRLKNINLLTNVSVIREDQTIQERVEDAACRSCLFAIVINSQNELHRSLTLNILHGITQEHRNMPLDDSVDLVARSFEKFLTAEKEKLAAQNKESSSASQAGGVGPKGPSHPKDIADLLTLLTENRQLSVEELDKVIAYLQDKRDKALGKTRPPPTKEVSPELQQSQPQPQPQQPLSFEQQRSPHYQQQQLGYQQQQQPYRQQQHSPAPQDPQSKILSMMNGSPAVPTSNTVPQNTLTSQTTPLLPAIVAARLTPPPPPTHQSPADGSGGVVSRSGGPSFAPSQASSSSAPVAGGMITPATLINFDNPTVQRALDNLIQSGPSLLKNLTATTGKGSWPGHGTALATSQAPGGYGGPLGHQQAPN